MGTRTRRLAGRLPPYRRQVHFRCGSCGRRTWGWAGSRKVLLRRCGHAVTPACEVRIRIPAWMWIYRLPEELEGRIEPEIFRERFSIEYGAGR